MLVMLPSSFSMGQIPSFAFVWLFTYLQNDLGLFLASLAMSFSKFLLNLSLSHWALFLLCVYLCNLRKYLLIYINTVTPLMWYISWWIQPYNYITPLLLFVSVYICDILLIYIDTEALNIISAIVKLLYCILLYTCAIVIYGIKTI